ncbi:MAG TPA: peptide chain release factor N(5)-glutamine methyltransferase, partial [Acidimicrobiales bacterium]|nr:peptide chain release factor N(5)-glutamine methyltransferase [Acidimicrobiales bacterium]
TWRELMALAEKRLGDRNEARRLVERASGYDGSDLILALDEQATRRTEPFFLQLLERRAAGEPLQYVLGRWGFRRLDLFVDRRVLIPRPETEMVVQVALNELRAMIKPTRPTLVDLGTGSGAIALSLAVEVPGAKVWATDASAEALEVARANLAGIGTLAASRVRLEHGSWFDPLPTILEGHVQLIVSNPPYIADDEDLPPEVAEWEPVSALRAGPTGLEDIARIVKEAPTWLSDPGVLVVEIAPHQAMDAVRLAVEAGFPDAETRLDLTGRERILVARW